MAVQPFDDEQQALVDKLVGDARVKAREKAKAESDAAAGDKDQQARINKLVSDAEEAARLAAKAEFDAEATKAAEKAAEDAATAKLAEEKKWEDLAAQHSAKLEAQTAELERLQAKVEAYEGLVATMLEDAMETLGDAAKQAVEALPGDPPILEKLVWLNQNEALFTGKEPPVGSPGGKQKGKKPSDKGDDKGADTPGPGRRRTLRL